MIGAVGPPGTKKKSQKGLLKAEAGELHLIEIHTKHTLKKFQPGKSKGKNKVHVLQTFMVTMEIVILQFFVSECFFIICNCNFYLLYFLFCQLELPLEELEGKIKKSKLKLVVTNGKLQGCVLQLFWHAPIT